MNPLASLQFGTRFNINPAPSSSEKDLAPLAKNFGQLLVTNLKKQGINEAKGVVLNQRVYVLTDTQVGQDVKNDSEATALINTAKQLKDTVQLYGILGPSADEFTPHIAEANLSLGKNALPTPKTSYSAPDPQNGFLARMMTALPPVSELFKVSETHKARQLALVLDDLASTLRYGQSQGRVVDLEIAPANKK